MLVSFVDSDLSMRRKSILEKGKSLFPSCIPPAFTIFYRFCFLVGTCKSSLISKDRTLSRSMGRIAQVRWAPRSSIMIKSLIRMHLKVSSMSRLSSPLSFQWWKDSMAQSLHMGRLVVVKHIPCLVQTSQMRLRGAWSREWSATSSRRSRTLGKKWNSRSRSRWWRFTWRKSTI